MKPLWKTSDGQKDATDDEVITAKAWMPQLHPITSSRLSNGCIQVASFGGDASVATARALANADYYIDEAMLCGSRI